jgi:hypothetical protein
MTVKFIVLGNSQRCGSTLVQRIINRGDQSFVWGETGAFLANFADIKASGELFSRDSRRLREVFLEKKSTQGLDPDVLALMQNLSPSEQVLDRAVLAGLRQFVETLYAHERYKNIGFKVTTADSRQVDLCRKAFPQAKLLLLAREPGAVYASMPAPWRAEAYNQPDAFAIRWILSAGDFIKQAANSSCLLIDYDDLVAKGASYARLLLAAELNCVAAQPALDLKLNSTAPIDRAPQWQVDHVSRVCASTYEAFQRQASMC